MDGKPEICIARPPRQNPPRSRANLIAGRPIGVTPSPRKLSERLYDLISDPWRAMVLTVSIVCLTVLVLAVLYRNHGRYVPDPGSYGILDTHTGKVIHD